MLIYKYKDCCDNRQKQPTDTRVLVGFDFQEEKEMKKTKTRVVYAVLKEYENGATMEYLAQKYGIMRIL